MGFAPIVLAEEQLEFFKLELLVISLVFILFITLTGVFLYFKFKGKKPSRLFYVIYGAVSILVIFLCWIVINAITQPPIES